MNVISRKKNILCVVPLLWIISVVGWGMGVGGGLAHESFLSMSPIELVIPNINMPTHQMEWVRILYLGLFIFRFV